MLFKIYKLAEKKKLSEISETPEKKNMRGTLP